MALWIAWYTHEDLDLNPQHNVNSQAWLHMPVAPALGDRDGQTLRFHWSANLPEPAGFWFSKRPCLVGIVRKC